MKRTSLKNVLAVLVFVLLVQFAIGQSARAGSIVGWGLNESGQATPPEEEDFVAIAAGGSHSLGLRADGSIAGWGNNYSGQAEPPLGNGFVAISAGNGHSLALKADGSIVGWGAGTQDLGAMPDYGQAAPPEGNDFVAISAGAFHSLALRADGSIAGWGGNWDGRASPPDGNDFAAVSAGGYHSLALKADGSIAEWGDDIHHGHATPPDGNDFVAVAAGIDHSIALKADGSIVGWGESRWGLSTPPEGNDFVAISAGALHGLALRADGSIVGWGAGTDDLARLPDYGQAAPPERNDFVAISAGLYHSLAIKEAPPIEALVKISPNSLNLQSKGRWVSCYIVLPEDYNVAEIDANSILLEDEIAPDRVVLYGRLAVAKFSRSAVQELLSEMQTPGEVELLVSGQLNDGTIFEGTDVIRVVGPERKRLLRRRIGR